MIVVNLNNAAFVYVRFLRVGDAKCRGPGTCYDNLLFRRGARALLSRATMQAVAQLQSLGAAQAINTHAAGEQPSA